MSSIEDRIVRMRFDNDDFERRIGKTMSSLDRLKEKLQFKDSSAGIKKMQAGFDSFTFTPLLKGIEAIEHRFSAVGIAGATLVQDLTRSAINAAKSLEQATIGQIKSGGWNRAMNIANAQFQIEGLGYSWSKVEKAVSYGVKDTAYGLDAAASAASQLAASGVDFEKTIKTVNGQDLTQMHRSLRAISGVAAMTNSSYEDISRIFTKVAGNGRLMGDELLSLSSRGMNAAATLGKALGKTEAEIRDMVSKGKIDFKTFADAMDDAFGDHAKEANKTFTGSLSNMKAALSRIGAIFATPVIDKTNTFFIALTERIDEVKKKLSDIDEKNPGFATHFAEAWQAGVTMFSKLVKAIDLSWFDKLVEKADSACVKIKGLFDALTSMIKDDVKEETKEVNAVNDATKSLVVSAEEAEAAKKVIAGKFGSGKTRQNKLKEAGFDEQAIKNIQAYVSAVQKAGWSYEKASIKVQQANKDNSKSLEQLREEYKALPEAAKSAMRQAGTDLDYLVEREKTVSKLEKIKKVFKVLGVILKNVFTALKKLAYPVIMAFKNTFSTKRFGEGATSFIEMLVKLSRSLIISDQTAVKIYNFFSKVFAIIRIGIALMSRLILKVMDITAKVLDSGVLTKIYDKVRNIVLKIILTVASAFQSGQGFFSVVFGAIKGLFTTLLKTLNGIDFGKLIKYLLIFVVIKKLIGMIFGIGGIFKLLYNFAKVPIALTNLFTSMGAMFRTLRRNLPEVMAASAFATYVKAFAIIAAVIFALSLLPMTKFANALAMILFLGILFKALSDAFADMANAVSIYLPTLKSLGIFAGALASFGAFIGQLATAMVVMASASAILSSINPENMNNAQISMVIFALMIRSFIKIGTTITTMKISKSALSVMGAFVIMLSSAFVIMAAAFKILSTIDPNRFTGSIYALGAITLALMSLSALIIYMNPLRTFKSLATFAGTVAVFGGFLLQLATSFVIMASAFKIMSTVDLATIDTAMTAFGLIFGGMALISAMLIYFSHQAGTMLSNRMLLTVVSFGAFLSSFAVAVLAMAGAFKILGTIDANGIQNGVFVFGSIMVALVIMVGLMSKLSISAGAVVSIIAVCFSLAMVMVSISGAFALMTLVMTGVAKLASTLKWEDVSKTLALMLGFAVEMLVIVYAFSQFKGKTAAFILGVLAVSIAISIGTTMLSLIANLSKLLSWEDISKTLALMLGFAVSMLVIAHAYSNFRGSTAAMIGGILAMSVAMVLLAASLAVLNKSKGTIKKSLALTILLGAITLALVGAFAAMQKLSGSPTDMLAVGATFMLMAGSMMILALALKEVAGISDNLDMALATFGIFAGVMALLGGLSALFPNMARGMEKIGVAFLAAGAGMALVGAGILLVCKGVAILSPMMPQFNKGLEGFFQVLEGHRLTAVIVAAAIIGIVVAVIYFASKIVPLITTVAEIIKSIVGIIEGVFKSVTSSISTFVGNLSTKGKIALVAVITTLCAALVESGPTIMNTIGIVLDNVFNFLDAIIFPLANRIVGFVLNLIDAVSDAIGNHSSSIWTSLLNVFISLGQLIINAFLLILSPLKWLVEWMFDIDIDSSIKEWNETVADARKEISRSGRDNDTQAASFSESLSRIMKDSEESTKKSAGFFDSLTEKVKELTSATQESESQMASFNQYYQNMPAAARNEMEKARQAQNQSSSPINFKSILSDASSFDVDFSGILGKAGDNGTSSFMSNFNISDETDTNFDSILSNTEGFNLDLGSLFGDGASTASTNFLDGINISDDVGEVQSSNIESILKVNKDQEPKVKESGTTLGKAFASGLESTKSEVETAAKNLTAGITKKINEYGDTDGVIAMANLAKKMLNAFTSFNKIQSPSRLYYEEAGYIVSGLSMGIQNGTAQAESSMENLSKSMVTSFGDPLKEVASVINSDVPIDPTIRPVVDMNEVTRGVRSFESSFDGGRMSVTGKLSSDLNGFDRSIVEELRALRSDMNAMSAAIEELGRPNQSFENEFNIQSDDPREVADQVSRILQRQVERREASWA